MNKVISNSYVHGKSIQFEGTHYIIHIVVKTKREVVAIYPLVRVLACRGNPVEIRVHLFLFNFLPFVSYQM